MSREAERAIKGGQPFLQRYLPFWLANLVERMWLALGIIIAILLPLSRIVPPLYEFRIRSRVFRWYGQLRAIELQMQAEGADPAQLAQELDALEQKVARHQRAAVLRRRALRAAQQHQPGAPPARGEPGVGGSAATGALSSPPRSEKSYRLSAPANPRDRTPPRQ